MTIKGVNKMYFEEAVKRINKINWELFGEVVFDEKNLKVSGLGTEYLKNIALFFMNNIYLLLIRYLPM